MIVVSEFSEVRRGIEDPHVFDVPPNCKMLDLADLSLYKVTADSVSAVWTFVYSEALCFCYILKNTVQFHLDVLH